MVLLKKLCSELRTRGTPEEMDGINFIVNHHLLSIFPQGLYSQKMDSPPFFGHCSTVSLPTNSKIFSLLCLFSFCPFNQKLFPLEGETKP